MVELLNWCQQTVFHGQMDNHVSLSILRIIYLEWIKYRISWPNSCCSCLEGYQELAASVCNAKDEVCQQGNHRRLRAGGEQASGVGRTRTQGAFVIRCSKSIHHQNSGRICFWNCTSFNAISEKSVLATLRSNYILYADRTNADGISGEYTDCSHRSGAKGGGSISDGLCSSRKSSSRLFRFGNLWTRILEHRKGIFRLLFSWFRSLSACESAVKQPKNPFRCSKIGRRLCIRELKRIPRECWGFVTAFLPAAAGPHVVNFSRVKFCGVLWKSNLLLKTSSWMFLIF